MGYLLISNEVLVYMIEFKKFNFQCLIKQYSNALDKVLYIALTWTFGWSEEILLNHAGDYMESSLINVLVLISTNPCIMLRIQLYR